MSNSGNSSLFIELTFFRINNIAIQEGNNQYLEMCLMYDHFRWVSFRPNIPYRISGVSPTHPLLYIPDA